MNVWKLAWRTARHEPRSLTLGWLSFILFFTFPVAIGWLLGVGFRELQAGHTRGVYAAAAGVAVCEFARMATIHFGALQWTQAWVHMQTFLRSNMLAAQVASGGPEAGQPVGSAGEALTHFRDDTEDITMLVDGLVDVSAGLVFTVLAAFVLGNTDPRGALVIVIPLVGVVLATRALDSRVKLYRAADREAAAAVGGLLGDVMAAATTIKVNDAADNVMTRLRVLIDHRRHTAVRDRVLDEAVWAISQGATDVGFGLVLLVSASTIASGALGVGDLAVFVAYLGWLGFFPRMVGRMIARRKQAAVAVDRMRRLVADQDVARIVTTRVLPVGLRVQRDRPDVARPDRVVLELLEVRGLSAVYPSGAGVFDVDLTIPAGTFTVITGPVGSGKSTLLRAILGLSHQAATSGDVCWNGAILTDRGAFLVPPNAAYLPQVPQLISDSLADNITLGPPDADTLMAALELAAVGVDIAEMPDGVDTMIGPRGVRLSGGQRQRVATARALVHRPEVVVLDDLSSALDVETELQLWHNLAAAGMTVLAVSHRAVAFDRADQVLHMAAGRLVAAPALTHDRG